MGVRPCVAFLHAGNSGGKNGGGDGGERGTVKDGEGGEGVAGTRTSTATSVESSTNVDVETNLIPRLNATEVSAIFSAPFERFLSQDPWAGSEDRAWYEGAWSTFKGVRWKMHSFFVPKVPYTILPPSATPSSSAATVPPVSSSSTAHLASSSNPSTSSVSSTSAPRNSANRPKPRPRPHEIHGDAGDSYRVFGLTARILVDAARIAYGRDPEFDCNEGFGEEDLVRRMIADGGIDGGSNGERARAEGVRIGKHGGGDEKKKEEDDEVDGNREKRRRTFREKI